MWIGAEAERGAQGEASGKAKISEVKAACMTPLATMEFVTR